MPEDHFEQQSVSQLINYLRISGRNLFEITPLVGIFFSIFPSTYEFKVGYFI